MNHLSNKLIATVVGVGVLALGASTGAAKGGVPAVAGTCSATSAIKAKAQLDNGLRQVEFEVDQNVNGVTWAWKIARGTATLASGSAVTVAPSGSFSVRRLVSNGPVQITATRAGETCTVSL